MKEKRFTFQKHILICGKTEAERHKYVNLVLEQSNLQFFRFPKSMSSLSDYLNIIQTKKLFFPFYETKGKYNSNQILDFHIDWIADNNCLFVFEEFQNTEDKFKIEILRIMINNLESNKKSATKLIISLDDESKLIHDLSEIIEETINKSTKQILESSIHIISL